MVRMVETRRFWWFALGQFALWSLLPELVFRNLPLDVVEGLVWGHGWPVGTYKHPPLQAWLLEIVAILGGRSDLAIYSLSAACLLVTYLAVWRLGNMLLAPAVALMGVLALGSCFYFATSIPEFNPNVVQMPLFALCGLWFWQAFQHNRWIDWLLLGLCGGLGLYGKYSFALMLASFGVFVLLEPTARRLWRSPGAWLAACVAALVFIPHVIWLQESGWLPFAYARSRTELAPHMGVALWWTVRFALNQLLVLAPVAIVLWLSRVHHGVRDGVARNLQQKTMIAKIISGWNTISPAQRYLMILAWSPFLFLLALSLFTGGKPRDMWGMALWPFIGLWLASLFKSGWERNVWARRVLWLALLIMPMATVSGAMLSVPFGFRPWRTEFSGKALAQAADELWQAQGWDKPLRIVLSDAWYGGTIAWYGRDRAQVMITGDQRYSPWVTAEMIREQGALVAWDPREGRTAPPGWATQYGAIVAQKTVLLPYGREQVPYALAVIAPQP